MSDFLFSHMALGPMEFPALEIALAVVWILLVGGSIGSFLNVVVYRVPRGLSIVHPPSHCPRCRTPILPRDNLPVVGWLLLRGRCRACGLPISARYPSVELAYGLVLLLLAFCEPLTEGAALPIPRGAAADAYPLWGMMVYHFVLLAGIGSAALMAWDRRIAPAGFWQTLLMLGLLPPLIWPRLRPVPLSAWSAQLSPAVLGLTEGLVGAAVGAVIGMAAWPASSVRNGSRTAAWSGAAATACAGAFLGWQAAAGVGFAAMLAWATWQIARRLGVRIDLPWPAFLAAATLAWLPCWRAVVALSTWRDAAWLGSQAPWFVPVAAAGGTLALASAGRTLADGVRSAAHAQPSEI